MKRKLVRAGFVALVVIVILAVAIPVFAADGDVEIVDVTGEENCPFFGNAYVDLSFNTAAGDNYDLWMHNETRGLWYFLLNAPTSATNPSGPWDVGTIHTGDRIEFWVDFYNGPTLVDSDSFSVTCGSVKEEPYTGIYLLSTAEQTPYLSVSNAAGDLPCGVFDVNGWGRKYVGLGDFPGCTAPVTVMCFNDNLEWTADNVSDVVMQGDYEVDFTSSQHGTCALFAQ